MRIRMWLAGILATLGISTTALAGTNTWTDLGPDGGYVRKVVFHPTQLDTAYAITFWGTYRSQNAGVSWQLLTEGNAVDLEIDPIHPERIYRATATQLLLSTDGGVTYGNAPGYPANKIASQIEISADGKTLYAAFREVFRSTDGGTSWTQAADVPGGVANGTTTAIDQLLIDPADSKTVYVLANTGPATRGLFLSEDGAESWELIQTYTLNSSYVFHLEASASPRRLWSAGETNVFVSSDRGRHFSPVNFGRYTLTVSLDPTDADRLYAGAADGNVYRTENAGATWTDVSGDLIGTGGPNALYINPARPTEIFAAGAAGLARTSVGGSTWSLRQSGISAARVESFAASPAQDRIYFTSSADGVHYIEGDSLRAAQLNISALRQAIQDPRTAYVRAFHAQDGAPGRMFAALLLDFVRSVDGGSSWQPLSFPAAGNNNITSIASAPDAPDMLFAATSFDGMFRSIDGGDHWLAASAGLPSNVILQQVAVAKSDPHTFYTRPLISGGIGPAIGVGVYRWTDAAGKWEPANTGISDEVIHAIAVNPANSQVVYAGGDHGLWETVNGGGAWGQVNWNQQSPTATAIAIDPVDPRILYVAGGSTARRSVDGITWEALEDPSRFPGTISAGSIIVDPDSPDTILIGTFNNGVQRFTVSPDLSIEALAVPAGPVSVGAALTYKFTAFNLGPFASTDTQVQLQLPAGTQSISVEPATSCVVSGVIVTCDLAALRAGFSSDVTLHASPAAFGDFVVTASAHARQPDPVTTNNATSITTAITRVSDLAAQASGAGTARVGDAVSYTLIVANSGPDAAADVQLKYQLAAGLTPGTVTTSRGSCTVASLLVTCNLGEIAAQASVSITVNATASAAGAQSSTATLTSSTAESASTNNTSTVTTTVSAAPSNPNDQSSGGGGGGGALSLYWTLILALIAALSMHRRYCHASR